MKQQLETRASVRLTNPPQDWIRSFAAQDQQADPPTTAPPGLTLVPCSWLK